MRTRHLGTSGLRVSRLGLGTMTWGRDTSVRDAGALLDAFCTAGGTLVDASAILLKFLMKPGPYDTLVDRDEYRFEEDRTQYKELYGQRAREFMQKEIDALAPKKIPVQQSLRTLS